MSLGKRRDPEREHLQAQNELLREILLTLIVEVEDFVRPYRRVFMGGVSYASPSYKKVATAAGCAREQLEIIWPGTQ